MKIPRMTIRRWMIVMVIVAVALGVLVTLRRAADFMRLAALHRDVAHWIRRSPGPGADPKLIAHHEDLARKYERAAARPWLPIDTDPPAPESE
jgi:hypothetical protein